MSFQVKGPLDTSPLDKLRTENAALKEQNVALQNENSALKEQNAALRTENSALKSRTPPSNQPVGFA